MKLALSWSSRDPPLEPIAVVAQGDTARRLCAVVLARPDASLRRLRGVAAPNLLALEGATNDLPWADGVSYLGRDPEAPGLLVPTNRKCEYPLALVERAIFSAHPSVAPPVVVLLDPPRLVSLAVARPLDRAGLLRVYPPEEAR